MILALLDDTNFNTVPSSVTTGEPVAGVRLVPVMAICCVVEFRMALSRTGVAARASIAEQTSQQAPAIPLL
jgi:hypothetical protein